MEAQWEGNLDTFGGFALSFDGLCLRDDGSRSRKVWNLLSYLILNRERDLGVAELTSCCGRIKMRKILMDP